MTPQHALQVIVSIIQPRILASLSTPEFLAVVEAGRTLGAVVDALPKPVDPGKDALPKPVDPGKDALPHA